MKYKFQRSCKNLSLCFGIGFIVIITMILIKSIYCASIQPTEGVVIRKDYFPASTHTTYEYIHQSGGGSIRIPVQKYDPERYQITIQGVNSKGEEDHGYYEITPQEYENIHIGDYYIKQIK